MTFKATRGFILTKLHERQQRTIVETANRMLREREQHRIEQEHLRLREDEMRRRAEGRNPSEIRRQGDGRDPSEFRRMERDREHECLNIYDGRGYLVQRIDYRDH